ncbi:MAG: NAD(P)/FAD-dependent oxidoreductase [Anaerolineaceae bacterium]|nr:NAD(P)/FAD-dependent oxidoreductase [Anaerolineaceae bacterium]
MSYDALVIGSGPNGLAAAITLAQAGKSVLVIEGKDSIGGGTRTLELTLPGFQHDMCSAIHPAGFSSSFLRGLPLEQFGLEWIHSPALLAHPLDDGSAIMLEKSVEATADGLGMDASAYRNLFNGLSRAWPKISEDLLGPLPFPPKHLLESTGFSLLAIQPAAWLARWAFSGQRARALFAGQSAHSMLPLENLTTAAFGLGMTLYGHAGGWPIARGGSHCITEAMAAYLRSLGGEIQTGWMVNRIDELPKTGAILFDLTPRQMVKIAGLRLPDGYRRQLEHFRYGQGIFKIDYALSGPIPWKAKEANRAATVHLGGTLEEIQASEHAIWHDQTTERPFVLLAQQSLFDPRRAPAGKHTAWAYCHTPANSTVDLTSRIEAQIERFAPGFQDLILGRATHNSVQMESYNPNYIGGDINGGVQDVFQFFTRPVVSLNPYKTPAKGIYICSSSTPPGGGVHGLCGYYAARAVLKDMEKSRL